jgi:RND family efflux transporter MFP subunit
MEQDGETTGKELSALRIDPRARSRPGWRKRIAFFLVGAAVLVALVMAWASLGGQRVTVEVAPAISGSGGEAAAVLNASGYVTPRRRATVAAKITGRVVEMLVEEGMMVQAGQLLAQLDDADARARLQASRAEREVAQAAVQELEVGLADAERTLDRIQKLERPGYVSVQELDRTKAAADGFRARLATARQQVRAAEARMDVAKTDLENCTVRAPFSGMVVSKDAQLGEMVSPISAGGGFTRTGIATIVDMASLEVEVDVNESHIAKVKPGQRVEATLDAYPEWRIPAAVRTVIPTADRQKATVKVRISFDALDPKILPDMGVKVSFLEEEGSRPTVASVLVPRDALREAEGRSVVFVVRQGRVQARPVRVGGTRMGHVELIEGISPGEQVVVRAPDSIKDGQRAEIK